MDIVCDWFISAPMEKHIEIEIPTVEMNTGLQLNCSANELEVFDGYTSYDAHRIVHICETTNVTTLVRSTGPFLTVSFRNNVFGGSKSALHRGFTMKYRTIEPDRRCGGDITNTDGDWDFSGTIDSPNYGGFYPPNMDCSWKLDGIGGGNGSTTDQTLKLYADGQLIHDGCNAHRPPATMLMPLPQFSGGKEEDKQINRRYICARYPFVEEGEFIMSATRPLVITYVSSGDEKNRGLLMEYTTMDVGCGGVFSQSTGTISSPNYPDKYLPHMHCVYQIQVAWSKQVRLTFDNFDIEVVQNDECSYDNVAVYESYVSPTEHGKLLGRFEGIDPSTDCDRTYTAPAGEIIFDGTQGRYSQCDFHISVISTARLVLKMNNMSIPCLKSQLILRNGASDQSPGFASLNAESSICDEYPMPVLRSHGSRVFLRLQTTDSSKTFFNISYEQIISSCGGHVEGVSGSIAAPQYPLKDSRSLDCSWTIAVALGNHVRFSLVNIDDLKSSDDNGFCGMFAANRLDVLDGPHSDARLMRRYCRRVVGAEPLTSEDHEISVRYKQHGGPMLGPLYGFMAHFSTVCTDIVLTDFTGSIQTPGYPNKVWTGQYCSWTIKVPPGNRIQVNFHNFVIDKRFRYGAQPGKCADNWLKFGEGEVAEATVKIGNSINVTNKLVEACSDVAKPTVVKAPVGKRVLLIVNTLSIFQKTEVSCQYNDENEEFTGLAYQMKSVMADSEGNFFVANVTFVDADANNKDQCGGVVEVSRSRPSSIHSPRFPEEYERGTECQWLFVAPPGYYLIYTIKEYITPNAHEQQTEKKWIPRAINNLTKSEKIERVCLDIEEPKEVPVFAAESLVTFRGASTARIHMTGEDQHVRRNSYYRELRVPYSPNCTDSYLEFRKWNSSGPLIGRWCEKAPSMFGMEEAIWMKFRYVKPKEADSEEDLLKPNMRILFSRVHGGTTTSHVIEQPRVLIEEMYTNFMWIAEGEPDMALLVHIDSIRIPEENYEGYDGINKIGLFLSEAVDNPNANFIMNNGRPGSVRVAGFIPPADIYLPFSRLEVSFFAPPRSAFRLTWKSVPKRSANYTEEENVKNVTKVYACGSTVVPTWEWQEITNPVPAGKTSGYENNVHCKWTIERPLMTGLRIKMLDLEDVGGCPFDFISLLPDRDAAESDGE
ncbi:CUB domain protein [Ancylostoma ceylanicum]|uniref:CUB domain protein n=1 Tax=Ancylostoma ceylanicum TaxID=53326 RepID=A0A0D6LBB0_9BILA|nr:CUB domain protein [Ancylostoma ceylanicum]